MNQPTKQCLTIKHLIILVIFTNLTRHVSHMTDNPLVYGALLSLKMWGFKEFKRISLHPTG
jgi:hypothetical protein